MLEKLNKLCNIRENTDNDFTKQSELKTLEDFTTYIDSVELYEKVKTIMYFIDNAGSKDLPIKASDPEVKATFKNKYAPILRFIRESGDLPFNRGAKESDFSKVEDLYNIMVAEF